jgi:hypothetical protein
MLNNYSLADAANIARADALQSFNFSFREKMEDYLTFTQSELSNEIGMGLFQITDSGSDITFDQLQKKFEENILLNTSSSSATYSSVLDYVSQSTINNFIPWTYGKYRVELNSTDDEARKALYDALRTSINRQYSAGEGFLEVVDCSESSCPKGSFYFNVPLSKLTDEEYELIPRLIVKDTFTQEQIKMAILPKTDIKVYIPLRFFKVLYEAMDAAKGIKNSHARNAEFKLGFCDSGYCYPRTNPNSPPSSKSWANRNCPTSEESQWIITLDDSPAGNNTYFSGGKNVGKSGLMGYGAVEVCKESIAAQAFEVESDPDNFFVLNTDLSTVDKQRNAVIPGCGYYQLLVVAPHEAMALINNGANQKLYCGRITDVAVDIVFVDQSPNFLVKGTSVVKGVKSNMYKIRISDKSFVAATPEEQAILSYSCNSGGDQCNPA